MGWSSKYPELTVVGAGWMVSEGPLLGPSESKGKVSGLGCTHPRFTCSLPERNLPFQSLERIHLPTIFLAAHDGPGFCWVNPTWNHMGNGLVGPYNPGPMCNRSLPGLNSLEQCHQTNSTHKSRRWICVGTSIDFRRLAKITSPCLRILSSPNNSCH